MPGAVHMLGNAVTPCLGNNKKNVCAGSVLMHLFLLKIYFCGRQSWGQGEMFSPMHSFFLVI